MRKRIIKVLNKKFIIFYHIRINKGAKDNYQRLLYVRMELKEGNACVVSLQGHSSTLFFIYEH